MAKKTDKPTFGPLQGVRVLHATSSLAGPFAAALMADMGADVVWIENPDGPDIFRGNSGAIIQSDRRNQRSLSMKIASGEGRDIFLEMLKETDIFLQSSKGGQYARWGLTDEVMWEANPKLIIVHISGFGQTGDPSYISRASYDPIAQAFAGMLYINSTPGKRSTPAHASVADYYTGYSAAFAALAAYIRMLQTGVGDSIDVAQYEAVIRCMNTFAMDDWNLGTKFDRENDPAATSNIAGYNSYMCKDGSEVFMLILGTGVVKNGLPAVGLEYGSELFPAGSPGFLLGTPAGDKLEETIIEFCASRTAQEVDDALSAASIPCSQIMTYDKMLEHPHYKARETITTWKKVNGEEHIGVNVVPRFSKNPGQIWRSGPTLGLDNDDILSEFGYDQSKIDALYEKGIIAKKDY